MSPRRMLVLLLFLLVLVAPSTLEAQLTSTGFYWPTGTGAFAFTCGSWLGRDNTHGGCYWDGLYHIGFDMAAGEESDVFAIADGRVLRVSKGLPNSDWGSGNIALLIVHTRSDGQPFIALYGHIRSTLVAGDNVKAGQVIGKIGPYSAGSHLHFGIVPTDVDPLTQLGRLTNAQWPSTNTFVDPLHWITSYSPAGAGPLIRDPNDPAQRVYLRQNGRIYHVLDENVLLAMKNAGVAGWDFASVQSVADLSPYDVGPTFIARDARSDGLLIRQSGANEIYVIQNRMRRWLRSAEAVVWMAEHNWFPDVIDVPASVLSAYTPSSGREIWGVGEGETDPSIKQAFQQAYRNNSADLNCQSSSSWKGWPGPYSKCLDFPFTHVGTAYASGVSGISGKYQNFGSEATGDIGDKGTINHSAKGTFVVHGAIYQTYKSLDYSRSKLGFPTSNEYPWGSYRRSNFEGGYIYWNPSTNATSVVYYQTTQNLTVSKLGSGGGTITSTPVGISCPGDCDQSYPSGQTITLTAIPGGGSTFAGWSGACSGSNPSCTFTMTSGKSVSATFNVSGPYLRLLAPTGAETWGAGTQQTLRWTSTSLNSTGRIYLYYWDNNHQWQWITSVSPSATSYTWNIPATLLAETTIWVGSWSVGGWEAHDIGILRITNPPGAKLYRVTVQNLTEGQTLTAPVVAAHSGRVETFRVGKAASLAMRSLAENGYSLPLMTGLSANARVTDLATGSYVVPGSDPEETGWANSKNFIIAGGKARSLTVLSKLVCTNDGFTGIAGVPLPRQGATVMLTPAYDAGTEVNTERFGDLTPDCESPLDMSEGSWITYPWLSEGGVIRVHSGIYGTGDLSPAVHGWWGSPVARVTVTRLGTSASGFAATLAGASHLIADAKGNQLVLDTSSQGRASFRLGANDTTLQFALSVRTPENVTAAHIHYGLPDETGPIVAYLDGWVARKRGALFRGTLDESDLLGRFSGNFSDFLRALRTGELYIDVHTSGHPGGEVRGQIGTK